MDSISSQLVLEPDNPQHLAALSGQFNEHLSLIAKQLNVGITNRGNVFQISGKTQYIQHAKSILFALYQDIANGLTLDAHGIHQYVHDAMTELSSDTQHEPSTSESSSSSTSILTHKLSITPRKGNQQHYVDCVRSHTVNFGIGPAGTGKTYLAVACAVEALKNKQIDRILLVRPAVEAGEKLGFLPGDLTQKIDPYLRPLYDALYEMIGTETVGKMIERNIIEVAPLAFMRGRTLNNAFIILDESQNTTSSQMKMFLTRIGYGSTVVITGDLTQTDLPSQKMSGLNHALRVLNDIDGISFTHFVARDVVRHPLVQEIVQAYELEASHTPSSQRNV